MTDDNMAIRVFRQGDSITSPLPNPIGSRPFQYQRNDRALALLVLACAAPLTQAVDTWQDASPHRSGIVDANGIQRHYLDWGGSGEAMVFLAGKTPAFHAIGMTRRGFGQSDPPDAGYDVPGRVADLVAFLDAMKIQKAVLVGHSVAGDELTACAVAHPARVIKLVYLDAAYAGHVSRPG